MPLTTNVAYYDWALKEVYGDRLLIQFIRNKPLLEKLERSSDFLDVSGKYLVWSVPLQYAQSFGVLGEYDTATAPTRSRGKQAKVGTVQHIAQLQISRRAIEASNSREAAWQNIKQLEVESLIEGLRQHINRALFADGTGTLATCGAMAAAGNTIPVSDTTYLFEDMYVDIYNITNDTALATQRQVTAVDTVNKTITISGTAVQTTANHVVVRSGSYKAEIDGLAKIVQPTGALAEINPADPGCRNWAAYRDTAGGNVSVSLLQKPFQFIQVRGGNPNLIVAGQNAYNAMATYLESQKRIPVEGTVQLPGGLRGLSWNGVECYLDLDCPSNTIYILDLSAICFGQVGEPGWISFPDGEGDYKLLHYVPRTTTYEAMWVWDFNTVCLYRNRLAAVDNVS